MNNELGMNHASKTALPETGSWLQRGGRPADTIRVNLDGLQADRRQQQLRALLDAAKDPYKYTESIQGKDQTETARLKQEARFVLAVNPLRAIDQLNSLDHATFSVDRTLKNAIHSIRENWLGKKA